jgi:CHASE2 domain-containing sensor protein
MKQLRKRTGLPAWKEWLLLLCVFALGVAVGRLLITEWQLVIGALFVGLLLLMLVVGGAKKR